MCDGVEMGKKTGRRNISRQKSFTGQLIKSCPCSISETVRFRKLILAPGSETSFWIKFFTDAGLPASDAATHAVSFTDNRMKTSMLGDLNKEYLNDLGITMMGDIIAILKHAKSVQKQTSREEALKGLPGSSTPPRRSTPASRTVAHYLEKDPNAGPMNEPMVTTPKISNDLAARLGPVNVPARANNQSPKTVIRLNPEKQKEEVPVPKSRRVLPEHEGKYTVKMPEGTTAKTKKILEKQGLVSDVSPSVFSRLGQVSSEVSSDRVKLTTQGNIVIQRTVSVEEGSVFGRLGAHVVKRAATSTIQDSDDSDGDPSALEYQGILKDSPVLKRKKIQITKKVQVTKQSTPNEPSQPDTAGIFSPFASHSKKSVTARLGAPVVAEAQTTTSINAGSKQKSNKKGVQSRLGPPVTESPVSTTTTTGKGVFSRLGKQLS